MKKLFAMFALGVLLAIPSTSFAQSTINIEGLDDLLIDLESSGIDLTSSGIPYGDDGLSFDGSYPADEVWSLIASELDLPELPSFQKISTIVNSILVTLGFFLLLVTTLVLTGMFKKQAQVAVNSASHHFWRELLTGFLVSILAPVIIFLLFISIFGFPLALATAALLVILVTLGKSLGALFVGSLIWNLFTQKGGGKKQEQANTFSKVSVVSMMVFTVLTYFITGPMQGVVWLLLSLWLIAWGIYLITRKRKGAKISVRLSVNWQIAVIGVFVFALLGLFPVVGHLARFAFTLVGIGAVSTLMYKEIWLKR